MVGRKKDILSEVGFEPTPTFVDQNTHSYEAKSSSLESGALDRSAILTSLINNKTSVVLKLSYIKYCKISNVGLYKEHHTSSYIFMTNLLLKKYYPQIQQKGKQQFVWQQRHK